MSLVNFTAREITCKIVYYGPGRSGKTTNLHYVYERVPETRVEAERAALRHVPEGGPDDHSAEFGQGLHGASPTATGSPRARHSATPSLRTEARRPWARRRLTASGARTQ